MTEGATPKGIFHVATRVSLIVVLISAKKRTTPEDIFLRDYANIASVAVYFFTAISLRFDCGFYVTTS